MTEEYRLLTVQDGLEAEEPIAVAFEAIVEILSMVDQRLTFAVLANVVAYGLRTRDDAAYDAIADFDAMILDCVAANNKEVEGTLQ